MDEARKNVIVQTLSTLVDKVLEQRQSRTADPTEGFRVKAFRDWPMSPPEASVAAAPVGYALRLGIKHLGLIIAAEGGFDLMQEISDRVDSLPQYANTSRPAVIIDHAWDGIGGWYA